MVEFLHVRRWEKRNRANFYWVMLLLYTIWKYWNILPERLDIVKKYLWISSHFDTESFTWKLDIVFLSDFWDNCPKIYIIKHLNNLAHKDFIFHMLLRLPDQNVLIFLQAIYNLRIFGHFDTKNYAWILDIVQKSLWILSIFLAWLFRRKCPNNSISKCVPGGKMSWYPQFVYYSQTRLDREMGSCYVSQNT